MKTENVLQRFDIICIIQAKPIVIIGLITVMDTA